jgi:hypothetical protein
MRCMDLNESKSNKASFNHQKIIVSLVDATVFHFFRANVLNKSERTSQRTGTCIVQYFHTFLINVALLVFKLLQLLQ